MATVKTETIHGVKVNFEVDIRGQFSANVGEHGTFRGETFAEVEEAVHKVLKKLTAKPEVEITFLGINATRQYGDYRAGDDALDATLRGYAARTRSWLVTIDGKKQPVVKSYSDGSPTVCRRLTPAEHVEWQQLQEARRAAATAIEDFIGVRKLDTKAYTDEQ